MAKKEDSVDLNMGIGVIIEGSEMEQVHYQIIFDEYVDEEVRQIAEEMKEERTLRKMCWIKTICYPLEMLLTYFMLGKSWVSERREQQQIFNALLKRKITVKQFQEKLMDLSRLYLEKKNA